jgi:hypothetical protein
MPEMDDLFDFDTKPSSKTNKTNTNSSNSDGELDSSFNYTLPVKGPLTVFEEFNNKVLTLEKEKTVLAAIIILLGTSLLFFGTSDKVFGFLISILMGTIVSVFLCLVFDTTWDTEMGLKLIISGLVIAIPFAAVGMKYFV